VAPETVSVRPHGLSKSRAMAGLQCHKLLWWMAHEPAAPELEVDDARQAVEASESAVRFLEQVVEMLKLLSPTMEVGTVDLD